MTVKELEEKIARLRAAGQVGDNTPVHLWSTDCDDNNRSDALIEEVWANDTGLYLGDGG